MTCTTYHCHGQRPVVFLRREHVLKPSALAKVRHLGRAVARNQHVVRLQVAVDQRLARLLVVEVLEAPCDSKRDVVVVLVPRVA